MSYEYQLLPVTYRHVSLMDNLEFEDDKLTSVEVPSLGASKLKCEPCNNDSLEVVDAQYFCNNCLEGLCETCAKYHRNMKALRNHVVTELGETTPSMALKPFSSFATAVGNKCNIHPHKDLDFFCVDHQSTCCVMCIALGHRKCETVKSVDQVDIGNDFGFSTNSLFQRADKCASYAQSVVATKERNLQHLQEQKNKATARVASMIRDTKTMLDTLESNIQQDMDNADQQQRMQLQDQVENYKGVVNKINEAKNKLETSLKFRTKLNVIQQAPRLEELCRKYEHEFQNDKDNDSDLIFGWSPDVILDNLVRFQENIGKLHLTPIQKLEVPLHPSRRIYWDKRIIKRSEFNAKTGSDKNNCLFTGAGFTSRGEIILADHSNRKIKLFTRSGSLRHQLRCEDQPWDVCMIDDENVLVSFPAKQKIQVFRIREKIIPIRNIAVEGNCHGVSHSAGKLVVTFSDDYKSCIGSVKYMDMQGRVTRNINTNSTHKFVFEWPHFVHFDGDRNCVYVTDESNGSVVKIMQSGAIQWICREAIIKSPTGIDVDNEGNIFVCAFHARTLVQLSRDGHVAKEMLTDVENPLKIAFDKLKNNFVLTNGFASSQNFVGIYQCI
ncbi:uncharacterized protein LOC125664596 [Ostrea edulis]|uniref:uncharacterized protein LOC125664596 n=1 Tax=Ostrea edulis TaxID=37623 RepID=UPI0024AF4A6C|nr:uncharacterized protein LOC125664596 [Ostrea edulis]